VVLSAGVPSWEGCTSIASDGRRDGWKKFPVRDLAESLPTTIAGRHIGNQLLRAGTSPAPNYAKAHVCEGMRDFIHKLGIELKELNESRVWLRMVRLKTMVPCECSDPVFKECDESCRMISASRKTAEMNQRERTIGKNISDI